ncbi:alpha/beta hydrolase family protein [Spirillospora sp. CA-294931]|uniref:alpha/beta hydrolase family protein n=1 Tax=Spirillospora sp. CA-294931 TaxID=3240042 RepID=UPI003D8DF1EE
MRTGPLGVILLTTGLAFTSSTAAVAAAPGETSLGRGSIVSVKRVARMSAVQVERYLAADHPNFASPRPRHGVDTYQVVYRTLTPRGRPTTASGVVSLPRTSGRLRAVSYAHGTHASRNIAGSVDPVGQSRVVSIYYAGARFAGVAPDYLGLGLGPGFHPYMHAASEAGASLDLLRAARTLARGRLDERVLVTGFSQGGQAAMALGRELQRGADPRLRLGALAPISGPYDIRHAQLPASFDEDGHLKPEYSVFYLAYVIVAWNRLFRLYGSPSEAFQAPYDRRVERLFDGHHDDFEEIARELPRRLGDLLTPRFARWLRHPSGAMLEALRAADGTCDWTPRAPVRVYAARGDEQVAFANTRSCLERLRSHGAAPSLVDYGPGTDHFTTLFRGVPDTLRWFQRVG